MHPVSPARGGIKGGGGEDSEFVRIVILKLGH